MQPLTFNFLLILPLSFFSFPVSKEDSIPIILDIHNCDMFSAAFRNMTVVNPIDGLWLNYSSGYIAPGRIIVNALFFFQLSLYFPFDLH